MKSSLTTTGINTFSNDNNRSTSHYINHPSIIWLYLSNQKIKMISDHTTSLVYYTALASVSLAYLGHWPLASKHSGSKSWCPWPLIPRGKCSLYTDFELDAETYRMIGLVEIGMPSQLLAMQFNTRYTGVIVQSINKTSEAAGALWYNMYHSSIVISTADFITNLYLQRFVDRDKITYTVWLENFNIGSVLFLNVLFS